MNSAITQDSSTVTRAPKRLAWSSGLYEHWPAALFFFVSLFIFYFLSNHVFEPDQGKIEFAYPAVFSGDEPHYMVIITSILSDGDFSLVNNYQSVRMGGIDAGGRFRRVNLDHHTLIKDVRTGQAELWEKIFDHKSFVDCVPSDLSCVGFKRIGDQFPDFTPANPNYIELPKHPIAYPGILAMVLRFLKTPVDSVEAHSIYLVVFFSWLTGIVTYLCCLDLGLTRRGSLLAVLILFFASPWLMYSHSMVPATFMGLLLAAALWALVKKQFAISAMLVAVASMQSEAFVLIIPAWAALLYFSQQKRSAYRFAIAAAASIVAVSLVNLHFIGSVTIRDMSFVFTPALVWRTFIDPATGVLPFLPWCLPILCFLAGCFFVYKGTTAEVPRLIAAAIFPVAGVYMILPYTGGFCYGPRYWVPFLPWLSIALVLSFKMYTGSYAAIARATVLALIGIAAVFVITASILPAESVWGQVPWRSVALLARAAISR